ncbi:transcription factor AP-1-like [Anneissia japonica]|uniref:transcription factor AP-1-like n=1 Tax=Anneissia japonica TaxID=1529436 RepID=UPI001425849E|nr:transcription factor AP-1-like [Anneissia japonica]
MSTTQKKGSVVVQQKQQSKMETQFYEDHPNWIQKKKSMTLDLVPGSRTKKPMTLLSTPDVNMLKLASPELEKLIVNQQGNVCTTPTPTQFICPKNVTDEQAAFAQGFVEALHNLHHITNGSETEDNQGVNVQYFPQAAVNRAPPNTVVTTQAFNPTHTTTTLPGAPAVSMTYTNNSLPTSTAHASVSVINNTGGWRHIKEEPEQTVPVYHATPPMSPIDMDTQERIKSERKRLRNRIAASKCRKRKLERISRLEDKVSELKSQNQDLQTAATKLREQVCRLKQNVMEHVKSGCQVMLAQQLAF